MEAGQCCGAGPFLTGSGSGYFFFTGSGSGSFSYKNRLNSSKKHVFAFTFLHRLRLRPKSTGSGSATLLGRHMNRQKWFHELFCFCEDIRSQSSKIASLRSQRLCKQELFSLDIEVLIFLNYC